MNYIQGNKFKMMAKWHYAPARIYTGHGYRDAVNNIPANDYRYLRNTLDFSQLQDGDIIYTHTFYADQLFEKLNHKVTCVTHNCDNKADIAPPDGIMWYTTNVDINHERVKSIPIGIENDFWLKDKIRVMESKFNKQRKFKNLVYCNHNIKTNVKQRTKPYNILRNKSWATCHMGINGQGFDNYIDNVYNHPFVVCPEGNGIDTHRVWECLYMGTIPVVTRNINNSFYSDLPMLFLDDWEEMTDKYLHDSYMEMSRKVWSLAKLDFNWWRKEIESHT